MSMIVRRADERGHADHGWLDSHHTFSFADYHDPRFMGFRTLRVINEDRVKGGAGFPTHPHRDMEIISYVLDGALEHKDSMGTGSVIRPGHVQRMSAGTGVAHSEFNHSKTDAVHFLQIWILPSRPGIAPGYEQKEFSEEEKTNRFRLVASPDGRDGSVTVHQDVRLFVAVVEPGKTVAFEPPAGRHAWLQVTRGAVRVAAAGSDPSESELTAGDGAAVSDATNLTVTAKERAEVLLFDLS